MTKPNISAEVDAKLKLRVQKKLKKQKKTITWLITESFQNYLTNG